MILLNVNNEEVPFTTTIFPDGTSQVWKIEPLKFVDEDEDKQVVIVWHFENEAELMHVVQLAKLAQHHYSVEDITLQVPYLPYGRQDKEIDNKLSFALQVFKDIMYNANICRIETFDPHSKSDMIYHDASSGFRSVKQFHASVWKHDMVCFPDKGAATRYTESFQGKPILYCEKVRNQESGEITGLILNGDDLTQIQNKRILIVDDICDGGMTFIKVAEVLKKWGPNQIDLAVSHGIFSKGRQCLHDAGIANIYTTNSLRKNKDDFRVLFNYD